MDNEIENINNNATKQWEIEEEEKLENQLESETSQQIQKLEEEGIQEEEEELKKLTEHGICLFFNLYINYIYIHT
ncbi:MAG: hypothetical protein L3J10_10195 [Sulfurimonas sp.]|nr:hypothetical protein [Sulfurimonas sp.]